MWTLLAAWGDAILQPQLTPSHVLLVPPSLEIPMPLQAFFFLSVTCISKSCPSTPNPCPPPQKASSTSFLASNLGKAGLLKWNIFHALEPVSKRALKRVKCPLCLLS